MEPRRIANESHSLRVALSRDEIEEEVFRMSGNRPFRKRTKTLQKHNISVYVLSLKRHNENVKLSQMSGLISGLRPVASICVTSTTLNSKQSTRNIVFFFQELYISDMV
ncbi:hypothetical protein YC2023_095007 [Brassica napus]